MRDKNYEGFGESKKLDEYVSGGREIFINTMAIFERVRPPEPWEFKLIGVTVAGVRPRSSQLSLFGHREHNTRLSRALDKINDKYGEFSIMPAKMLPAGKVFRDSVGFGRVKEL